MRDTKEKVAFTRQELGLLVATAIVGLWLLSFALGYDFGKDLGHHIFGNSG